MSDHRRIWMRRRSGQGQLFVNSVLNDVWDSSIINDVDTFILKSVYDEIQSIALSEKNVE